MTVRADVTFLTTFGPPSETVGLVEVPPEWVGQTVFVCLEAEAVRGARIEIVEEYGQRFARFWDRAGARYVKRPAIVIPPPEEES